MPHWMQLFQGKCLSLWSAHCSVSSPRKLGPCCSSTASCVYIWALAELHDSCAGQSGLRKHLGKKDRKRETSKVIRDWLCMLLLVRANEEIILVREGEEKEERWCQACMNRVGFCSFLAWLGFRDSWAWLRVPYVNAVKFVDLKSRTCTVAVITLVGLRIHELIPGSAFCCFWRYALTSVQILVKPLLHSCSSWNLTADSVVRMQVSSCWAIGA